MWGFGVVCSGEQNHTKRRSIQHLLLKLQSASFAHPTCFDGIVFLNHESHGCHAFGSIAMASRQIHENHETQSKHNLIKTKWGEQKWLIAMLTPMTAPPQSNIQMIICITTPNRLSN